MAPLGIAPAVQLAAAEWLVELQSDGLDAPARGRLLAQLQAWRAADAQHERAWQRIEAMGQRLQPLADTPATRVLAQAARASHPEGRRRALRQLALLLFAGGAAGTVAWQVGGDASGDWLAALGADLRTGTGERRSLQLPDGSALELNAGSAVDLAYGPQARLLRLRAGEILVRTAPAAPPFMVETRHGSVRALGTRFT
ncbi:MAG TPA: FecR domain-containing protein, partial [Pseudorhodoferax sp.]|nr:FecR domain-containing protein [Pseudorhodoferax sp.]